LRHREPGVPGYRSSLHCDPYAIEDEGSGRKPLLQKPSFCRSGFSRDLCAIENQGFRVTEAASTATLASSKAEVRGESPSYRNHLFVGAASAATFASSRTRGSGLPKRLPLRPLRHRRRRFGAKAPPTETIFCRSGFSRDLCAIENQGFRVTEAAFTATLASSKAEVRGESPSYRNHLFVGAASAATFAPSRTRGSGLPKRLPLRPLRHRRRRFGALPLR
jgi:hypothetical protein